MNTHETTWVVYQKVVLGRATGLSAVCEQSEWEEMERVQPGFHTLVQSGMINEGEAERLARGTPAAKPVK
jgi:hypothetical protein